MGDITTTERSLSSYNVSSAYANPLVQEYSFSFLNFFPLHPCFIMEKIHLNNADDAIEREKLFVKTASKLLNTLKYKGVDKEYKGEFWKSQKEMKYCEENQQKQIDKMAREHNENRIRKKSRDMVDLDSSDLGPEDFIAPMVSNTESRKKNKKKYKQGVTRSLRKRQVRAKQKRHRR